MEDWVCYACRFIQRQGVTVATTGAGENNKGAACFEANDLDAFMEILQSSDTAEA